MFKKDSSFQVLYAKNIEETHKFYKAIGAEIGEVKKEKIVVGIGDYEIHFIQQDTEPWKEYKYVAQEQSRGNGILFYCEVEDIKQAIVKVTMAEGNIKSKIKENWWNGEEFLFEDPNGYKFVLYQMK